jgi:hypothetical protein
LNDVYHSNLLNLEGVQLSVIPLLIRILVVVILFPQPLLHGSLHLNLLTWNLDSPPSTKYAQSPDSIIKLGAFSNRRYEAEHAYGYTVQLWREQNRMFGFLLWSRGLVGDTPTGLLEDVRYDPRTGQLSFFARLTTGLFSNRQFSMVPSRDVLRFKGLLKGRHIIGTLEVANALTPTEVPSRERIKLRLSEKESEVMIEAQSYNDWKSRADEILKFRGPKW